MPDAPAGFESVAYAADEAMAEAMYLDEWLNESVMLDEMDVCIVNELCEA